MIIYDPIPRRAPSYEARSLYHRARWQAAQHSVGPQLLLAATCEAAPVVEAIPPVDHRSLELHSIADTLRSMLIMGETVAAYPAYAQLTFVDYLKGLNQNVIPQ